MRAAVAAQEQYGLYDHRPPHSNGTTSRDAADLIKPRAQDIRQKVLDCIARGGADGATCDEIEQVLALLHQTAAARVRELALLAKIRDSGAKRETRSGRGAIVWRAE